MNESANVPAREGKEGKSYFDTVIENILGEHRRDVQKRMGKSVLRDYGFDEESVGDSEELSIADFFDSEDFSFDSENNPDTPEESELSEQNKKAEEAARQLIRKNVVDAARRFFTLKKEATTTRLMLKIAKDSSSRFSPRDKVIDKIADDIDEHESRLEDLANASPESYVVVHGYEFREHVRELAEGGIVTTPYVAEHMERLGKNMEEGRPTLIHGHLGSGKTELAIATARRAAITLEARKMAKKECGEYISENPNSSKAERREALGRFYRRNVARFEQALLRGDSKATERFSPLIISGSKDLTSQDLFADKTLKLTKFNGKPLLEHKKDLDRLIDEWKEKNPVEASDPDKFRHAADEILELFKLKNAAFGTEVETIKQAIYRGVEEGHPVIIDEVNAIPTAVLISLNDILQRRPGQNCYIPGVGPIKIAEGFSLTMTGNLSTGGVEYGGTGELNPAFVSRLDIIEHDYLPMSETDGGFEYQTNPGRNELFQVAIAYLADSHGDLELPEMDKSLDKIFRLCQLARTTQRVFGGTWEESKVLKTESGDEMEPSLDTSVLSMRNLLNVLRDWQRGLEKDLDKALWDSFVSTATNPDDKNMLIALARQYGFFSESDGWVVKIKERGESATSWSEIHPGDYEHQRKPMEVCDLRQVVDILYGKAPEREIYPDIDLDELEDEVDDEPTLEDFAELNNTLAEVDKAIQALKVLGEQCGCPAEIDGGISVRNTTQGA